MTGKRDDELAASSRAVAVRRDRAAVQPHQAPHDRQPEPEPALRAIERLTLLHEQVEDPRQHLRRDADAVVADA